MTTDNPLEHMGSLEPLLEAVKRELAELGVELVEVDLKLMPMVTLDIVMAAQAEAIETDTERTTRETNDAFSAMMEAEEFVDEDKEAKHIADRKSKIEGSMKSLKELLEGKNDDDT